MTDVLKVLSFISGRFDDQYGRPRDIFGLYLRILKQSKRFSTGAIKAATRLYEITHHNYICIGTTDLKVYAAENSYITI